MALAVYMKARACALAGLRTEAMAAMAELEKRDYVPSVWIAHIYAALGNRDAVFMWLERGFRERDAWLIEVKAWPAAWQSDPRFQDLIRRMGLSS
jgi:hypothetical protein